MFEATPVHLVSVKDGRLVRIEEVVHISLVPQNVTHDVFLFHLLRVIFFGAIDLGVFNYRNRLNINNFFATVNTFEKFKDDRKQLIFAYMSLDRGISVHFFTIYIWWSPVHVIKLFSIKFWNNQRWFAICK
jgi:hypothetical protein